MFSFSLMDRKNPVYLVVQHGETGETLPNSRLKEIREDPNHGHVRDPAVCTDKHSVSASTHLQTDP